MRQQSINGLRSVHAGSCHAWPLPADATCAIVARQVFKDAVSEVGLEPDLLDDCILMASELAANTLHARAVTGTGGGGDRFVSVAPDMGGEPIAPAGPASRDLLRQQGVLRHRENMIAAGLSVPARHPGESMSDVLDLDVERRRIEEIEPAARQHALPRPRRCSVYGDLCSGLGRDLGQFAAGRSRYRHGR